LWPQQASVNTTSKEICLTGKIKQLVKRKIEKKEVLISYTTLTTSKVISIKWAVHNQIREQSHVTPSQQPPTQG
jgi:hypothetical protein